MKAKKIKKKNPTGKCQAVHGHSYHLPVKAELAAEAGTGLPSTVTDSFGGHWRYCVRQL